MSLGDQSNTKLVIPKSMKKRLKKHKIHIEAVIEKQMQKWRTIKGIF